MEWLAAIAGLASAGHAERALGDDVLEHLVGPAGDRVGAGIEERVLPPAVLCPACVPLDRAAVRALELHPELGPGQVRLAAEDLYQRPVGGAVGAREHVGLGARTS